ncbi:MAG: dihydrofolate reductase family protein [Vicinamibacterales bacterium]
MRKVRYNVAASLDGFIARPDGRFDWIVEDASIDFAALTREFDTALLGRATWEVMRAMGPSGTIPGVRMVVCSTTLTEVETAAAGATLIRADVPARVAAMKQEPGRDIWLFGGGVLFRALLEAGLVDTVEVAVMPVLIGDGLRLLPGVDRDARLALRHASSLPSGIVMLKYDVHRDAVPDANGKG